MEKITTTSGVGLVYLLTTEETVELMGKGKFNINKTIKEKNEDKK